MNVGKKKSLRSKILTLDRAPLVGRDVLGSPHTNRRKIMNELIPSSLIDTETVRSRMVVVRGCPSLLMNDVAAIYDVEPREVGQAVKNNPMKFPEGYVIDLTKEEADSLKSKFLILETKGGRGRYSKRGYKVFTEKGLYMLATILKGERATRATLAIIETFAQVRSLKRDLLALNQPETKERRSLMHRFGETLLNVVMPDPDINETQASLELNFLVGKVKYTVRRVRKGGAKQ